jgi:hypothetical protein
MRIEPVLLSTELPCLGVDMGHLCDGPAPELLTKGLSLPTISLFRDCMGRDCPVSIYGNNSSVPGLAQRPKSSPTDSSRRGPQEQWVSGESKKGHLVLTF